MEIISKSRFSRVRRTLWKKLKSSKCSKFVSSGVWLGIVSVHVKMFFEIEFHSRLSVFFSRAEVATCSIFLTRKKLSAYMWGLWCLEKQTSASCRASGSLLCLYSSVCDSPVVSRYPKKGAFGGGRGRGEVDVRQDCSLERSQRIRSIPR